MLTSFMALCPRSWALTLYNQEHCQNGGKYYFLLKIQGQTVAENSNQLKLGGYYFADLCHRPQGPRSIKDEAQDLDGNYKLEATVHEYIDEWSNPRFISRQENEEFTYSHTRGLEHKMNYEINLDMMDMQDALKKIFILDLKLMKIERPFWIPLAVENYYGKLRFKIIKIQNHFELQLL